MSDNPTSYPTGLQGAATSIWQIVPDDNADLPKWPKAIRAVGAGTITLRAKDDEADIAHPVLDGERIDGIIRAVRATGTDVTVIGYA